MCFPIAELRCCLTNKDISPPGAPLLLTLVWTLLVYCNNQTEVMAASQDRNMKLVNTSLLGCPFISDSEQSQHLELLAYTLPVCLLLLCNFVFSIWIMAVSLLSTL